MPEMPEVEGLRLFLERHAVGHCPARIDLASFEALKTVKPPISALVGAEVSSCRRHGKFLDLDAQGIHLVFHLARGGWLTWRDVMPTTIPRPGRGPLALRLILDDGSGFDLTEAGTQKRLAIYVVTDPLDVPGISKLGVDPLGPGFTQETLDGILAAAGRSQIKGVLRDQSVLAGIGNAWSDEILHTARLSPFAPASGLGPAQRDALFGAITGTLTHALDAVSGLPPAQLKDGKRSQMAVHGRTGQPCPVCGTPVAEVAFADSSLQYCPGCQTGGRLLADRRMSRLLK